MVSNDVSHLPYRNNVSCVLFREDKYLLVQLNDWPEHWWKFPQGRIHKGESEKEAIHRELQEELGISKINIIKKSFRTNKYDWSPDSVKLAGYRWRGQIQKFYLVEYLGNDDEIVINKDELNQYRWVEFKNLFEHIDHNHQNFSNYKRMIEKVLIEFGKL